MLILNLLKCSLLVTNYIKIVFNATKIHHENECQSFYTNLGRELMSLISCDLVGLDFNLDPSCASLVRKWRENFPTDPNCVLSCNWQCVQNSQKLLYRPYTVFYLAIGSACRTSRNFNTDPTLCFILQLVVRVELAETSIPTLHCVLSCNWQCAQNSQKLPYRPYIAFYLAIGSACRTSRKM